MFHSPKQCEERANGNMCTVQSPPLSLGPTPQPSQVELNTRNHPQQHSAVLCIHAAPNTGGKRKLLLCQSVNLSYSSPWSLSTSNMPNQIQTITQDLQGPSDNSKRSQFSRSNKLVGTTLPSNGRQTDCDQPEKHESWQPLGRQGCWGLCGQLHSYGNRCAKLLLNAAYIHKLDGRICFETCSTKAAGDRQLHRVVTAANSANTHRT